MLSLYERSSSTALLDSAEMDTESGSNLYECKIALKLTGPMPAAFAFAPGWRGTFTARPKADSLILELESVKGQRFLRSTDVDIDCFKAVAHGREVDIVFAFICRVPFEDAAGLLTYLKQEINVTLDSAQTKIPAAEKPKEEPAATPAPAATPEPEPEPEPEPAPSPEPTPEEQEAQTVGQYALLGENAPVVIRTIRNSDDIDAIDKLYASEKAGKARKGLLRAMEEHLEALKAAKAAEEAMQPEPEEPPPLTAGPPEVEPTPGELEPEPEQPFPTEDPTDDPEEEAGPEAGPEDNGYGLEATIAWADLEGGERVAGRLVTVDREANEVEILDVGEEAPLRVPMSKVQSKVLVAGQHKPLCYLVDLYHDIASGKEKKAGWAQVLKVCSQAFQAGDLEQNPKGAFLLTEGIMQDSVDLCPAVEG